MESGTTPSRYVVRSGRRLAALTVAAGALVGLALTGPLRARASSPEPLPPNLVAEPPTGPELVTREEGGSVRLLLKFNGYVHNIGPGALDMKGSRSAPKLSPKGELELERFEVTHEQLSPELERELATPPMQVSQRLFTTNSEETNIERPHIEEPSSGVMIYADADGHNHWHLQHVARYSLWNASQSAEAAPSQKVGFCLEDSEHVDGFGPSTPVYEDRVRGEFCERYRPQATSLREGISRGWRDRYLSNLAFQWVDVSNVQPGRYWLREDVNPDGVVRETGGPNAPAYSRETVTIPGFLAESQSVKTSPNAPLALTLKSAEYGVHESEASYSIVTQPTHGHLTGTGNHVTYTPEPGYVGMDQLAFATRDKNSAFPRNPAVATVSIAVGEPSLPTLAIASAPAGMTAGTSTPLSAWTANYTGAVAWSASAGSVSPAQAQSTVFTAPAVPPPGGTVTVTARLAADPAVAASRTIAISPAPAPVPAQDLPAGGAGARSGKSSGRRTAHVSRPSAMIFGRQLVMSTTPRAAGVVGLSAYIGRSRLGHCGTPTPAYRRFTCRITLRTPELAHERLAIVATLRVQRVMFVSWLPAAVIPEMRMTPAGRLRRGARLAANGSLYWCSPSTLVETLSGGEE